MSEGKPEGLSKMEEMQKELETEGALDAPEEPPLPEKKTMAEINTELQESAFDNMAKAMGASPSTIFCDEMVDPEDLKSGLRIPDDSHVILNKLEESEPPNLHPTKQDISLQEICNRFTYHAPKLDQEERYKRLRALLRDVAVEIVMKTRTSREQSLALTHLEQAMFYANAAVARRE